MKQACSLCGMLVTADAMQDHYSDPLCMAEQHRLQLIFSMKDEWRRAGTTWQTLKKAGVPFKFIPFGFVDNRPHAPAPEADYIRCAPAWAVWVSEITGFTAKRRVEILQHCLLHTKAREAVQAAARLGALPKMVRGTSLKSPTRKVASDFFHELMSITDDSTNDVANNRQPVGAAE